MSTKYLSPAETAQLVRQALKESFPGVKFGVKSKRYTGGGSIDVSWIDGPNGAQVEEVAQRFAGSYFDSGIDYQGSCYHKLDGELVHFGASFVFCTRKYSDAAVESAIKRVAAGYGDTCGATVASFHEGKLWGVSPLQNWNGQGHWDMDSLIKRALAKHTDRVNTEASATLQRVTFEGDDGYGHGTVGMDGRGGDQCAKARQQLLENSEREALRNATPVGGVQ